MLDDAAGLFAFKPGAIYLDHGGFGAAPAEVLRASAGFREAIEAAPRPFFDGECRPRWREIAAMVARRFGADADELALVENATCGVNAVLRSLSFEPGDAILVTSMTYGAVAKAVRRIAGAHGAEVIEARLPFPPPSAEACVAALRAALRPRTKLAILDHVTSPTALVLPVAEMARVCREAGALVLVDGAHAPGVVELDLPSVGADFYAGNLHKWCFAPRACGFLWARREHARDLAPAVLSWDIERPFPGSFEWTGTRDASAWLSIPAAFAFMDRFGEARVKAHNRALVLEGADILAKAWGARLETPEAMIGAMALAPLPPICQAPATEDERAKIQSALWDEFAIACPCMLFEGSLYLRLSAQIYNTADDYRKLAQAVGSVGRRRR